MRGSVLRLPQLLWCARRRTVLLPRYVLPPVYKPRSFLALLVRPAPLRLAVTPPGGARQGIPER